MRKFLTKLFIYVLLLSIITLGINALCLYKSDEGAKKFTDGVPDSIQICNFGSSHGNDFNYADLSENYVCFNFAMGSQALLYDYKIMQNYIDKIQEGATVFILASYFSFFGKPEVEYKNFASKNRRYYKFLPANLIEQYNARVNFYVNYFPALVYENPFSLAEKLFTFDSDTIETADPKEEAKNAEARVKAHIVNRKDKNGIRIRGKEAFDSIYGMINLCRNHEFTPILITTPYLHDYVDATKKFDPDFMEDFYSVIDEIVQNTGIKYYDYSTDPRYSNRYDLFIDMDHMNREGARVFTNTLVLEVLSIDVNS